MGSDYAYCIQSSETKVSDKDRLSKITVVPFQGFDPISVRQKWCLCLRHVEALMRAFVFVRWSIEFHRFGIINYRITILDVVFEIPSLSSVFLCLWIYINCLLVEAVLYIDIQISHNIIYLFLYFVFEENWRRLRSRA